MVTDPERVPRARWLVAGAIVAIAGMALVGALQRATPTPADEPGSASPMLQVAPGGEVALSSLPADHQTLYLAADDDPSAFAEVTCYCGCDAFLGHRHLLDCFVRPAGGWERHATGCAVCLAEARQVVELRTDQVPIDEIVRRIDSRFGGITDPPAA